MSSYDCNDCGIKVETIDIPTYVIRGRIKRCVNCFRHYETARKARWRAEHRATDRARLARYASRKREQILQYHRGYASKKAKPEKQETKKQLVLQFGGCCTKCGYGRNLAALGFHHIDPQTKLFTIAWAINKRVELPLIQEECRKCVLLCNRCHTEEHNPDLFIE